MKFSIGDIVLLKRTGEEGRVVGFVNQEMIEVEVAGTHFPAFLDEVDHPYLKWFTEKKQSVAKKTAHPIPATEQKAERLPAHNVDPGFHLSFLPVFRFDEFEDVVDKLKTYFINQTAYELVLQYECAGRNGSIFSHKATLKPFSHFYLHDIPFEEMHDAPRFSWIVEQTHVTSRSGSMRDVLRIKPKKLFEYINKAQMANSPLFHIKLATDFPTHSEIAEWETDSSKKSRIKAEISSGMPASKKPTVKAKAASRPVDLHIENLVDNVSGLSNFEMLTIQLQAFEDAMDEAIALQQQSLIVIHGVGKGKLKEEIHSLLPNYAEVDFFQHDWSPRYGYGATEIFFRY